MYLCGGNWGWCSSGCLLLLDLFLGSFDNRSRSGLDSGSLALLANWTWNLVVSRPLTRCFGLSRLCNRCDRLSRLDLLLDFFLWSLHDGSGTFGRLGLGSYGFVVSSK